MKMCRLWRWNDGSATFRATAAAHAGAWLQCIKGGFLSIVESLWRSYGIW
jgi:hypothetical protein